MSTHDDLTRELEGWRSRAEHHARCLVSILATKGVDDGTFGEIWLREAKETVEQAVRDREGEG